MPIVCPSRVVIEAVSPSVDGGRFPAKRTMGDIVDVEADVFTEGHDAVAAVVRWRHESDADWHETDMDLLDNDRFRGHFVVDRLGCYQFTVVAWIDEFNTWFSAVRARIAAQQDVKVDLLEGVQLFERAAERATGADRSRVQRLMAEVAAGRLSAIDDAELRALMRRLDGRSSSIELAKPLRVSVERDRARFSSWYELFPRSTSADTSRPGTLTDVIERLPYVASMAFDVLYLPPVHPIGHSHRKGRNNSVTASREDVGSPWAIGAADGGHEAVHPALGTPDDIRSLVKAARDHGIEVALDLALQCSPDHPWVRDHPTWFRHRPDGSIRTAENPPKRYEDIFPLDFSSEDWQDLWLAVADLVETWIDRGVKIFRVDNPHTKPFAFWEWLLATTRQGHPDVIFLSEAFTRPKVMHRLAKIGFSQSYTYFTWRQSASELREYFTELRTGETPEYFRPNAWPNTPDILTEQLQDGTRGTFIARFVLAATLCASYGIYGPVFELGLREPRPGSEEYIDNEKYEVRWWDLDQPHSLRHIIATVNKARHSHTALQSDATLRFHSCDNPQLLCFSKSADKSIRADPDQSNAPIVVVVNTDPRHRQAGFIELDLRALGIGAREAFTAHDLLGGANYSWQGGRQYVELDALRQPVHIFELRAQASDEADDNHASTGSR